VTTTNATPAISVGIPVYNGENFLADAIASILAQTFTDFELIISDNASTDGTEAICRRFAESDPRVRYLRQPVNRGATGNYTHVMDVARGRYFKWAAHDDVLAPDFLARCFEVLESDPGCILVYPRTMLIDDRGDVITGYLDFFASDSEDAAVRFQRFMFPGVGEPNPIFGLMRKEVVQHNCPLGAYAGHSSVFLGQIALLGRSHVIHEALFYRRMHEKVSVRTHPDDLSREAFHTGKKAHGLRFRNLRVLTEYARAIRSAPISRSERTGCYHVLLRKIWKSRFRIAKELALPFYANGQPTALGRWAFHIVRPGKKLRSERQLDDGS